MFTPDRAYLLVGWPRTGSSVLAEALTATGVLGRPQEYFWRLVEHRHAEELDVPMPLDDHYDLYLDRALRFGTTPNGVFAAKMFWAHAEDFVRRTGFIDDFAHLSPLERLAAPFGPELRAVFVLFEIEELSLSEIAGLLGIPAGTAASRLRRARETFRAIVKRRQAAERSGMHRGRP